jgi:hypothetical protein
LPRKGKSKYKKDEPKEVKVDHCKPFDVVNAVVACIHDGWMSIDEWEQIYLGVKEKVSYVRKSKS